MTTHKEMTLEPCREAFEKWFLGQDANMPIDLRKREDGEYEFLHAESDWTAWQAAWNTRHLATLREDGGEPCCDVDLNETVWHDKYHQLCEWCWKALGITEYTGLSIPEHIAALKNPSDAGGIERDWTGDKDGFVTFHTVNPAPPQADTPIKGAGELGRALAKDLHDWMECPADVALSHTILCRHYHTIRALIPAQREDVSGEAVIVRVIKEDLGWKGTCTRIGEEYACVPDKPPTVEGWHVIGTVLHIAKDCGEVIPFFTKNPATLQREYAALTATPAPIDAEALEVFEVIADFYNRNVGIDETQEKPIETIRAALKKGVPKDV